MIVDNGLTVAKGLSLLYYLHGNLLRCLIQIVAASYFGWFGFLVVIQIVFSLFLTPLLLDHAFPNFVKVKFLLCEIFKIEGVAKSECN